MKTQEPYRWSVEVRIISFGTHITYTAFLETDDPKEVWGHVEKGRAAVGEAATIIRVCNTQIQICATNDEKAFCWLTKILSAPPPEYPDIEGKGMPPFRWADAS